MELLITIDTEPDCDVSWKRSSPLTFTSVLEGIPHILRPLWDRYNIKPLYFLSPEVVRNDECCKIIQTEINKGAVIGAHLHSEYIEPNMTINDPAGKVSAEFPCYAHSKEVEFAKINNLTILIKKKLDCRPVWYRAARYGADLDTMRILSELGYKYDSSVTPGINWKMLGGPDHRKAPQQPYWISTTDYYAGIEKEKSIGIMEYPITIAGKRLGLFGQLLPDSWLFYNWLRPTHMTVCEEKRLIDTYIKKYQNPSLVLIFHSMEIMINKTPFVRNRIMQRRLINNLDKIISYALNNQGKKRPPRTV